VELSVREPLPVARHSSALAQWRAALSLKRVWKGQGKRYEAHRLLTRIYGWFTERFDPANLQEAKALLEELS
jgi:hypothetical protein